ncbi:MAG TPA: hypothetical protein VNT75_21970, partial [Symbiobacteriaceae bacterium]|nr:hypothetical protein [Symbiobacteriaceae bacterium]
AGAFPTNTPISLVGAHFKSTLGALYVDAFRSTVTIAGRGIALALPLGVFTGLLAGLRPGSLADRLLTTPAALLAGVPALPAVLAVVCLLSIDLGWASVNASVHLALALASFPWIALAIRNSLASIVQEGTGVHPARAMVAIFGAVLGQAGNVGLASLAVGVYLVPDDGMLRLLELASRMGDPVMLYVLLTPSVLLVASAHLIGDLFTTFAGGPGAAPRLLSRSWTVLGAILLATGLSVFAINPPGAANTLMVALGALLVAGVAGVVLAVAGPLTPSHNLPSLLPPVIIGLAVPVLFARSLPVQMAAIGLGCATTLALPLRRLLDTVGPERHPAAVAAAGAGLLALAQAVGAQVTLSIMNIGLPLDLPTLGEVVRTSLLADPAAQHYLPVVPVLALPAGLFLLGLALKERAGDEIVTGSLASTPEEQVPVEPEQYQETTQESAG